MLQKITLLCEYPDSLCTAAVVGAKYLEFGMIPREAKMIAG